MRVLGIDPGTAICGYGVIDSVGSRLLPVTYGAILTTPDQTTAQRLEILYNELTRILKETQPDKVGVEELFFNRNVTTAISVGQARGVALLTAANRGIQITEFTPMQIKQAIVGYGKADKHQIQEMVRMILHQEKIIRPDDAADAVAVAITHANTGMLREQFRMK